MPLWAALAVGLGAALVGGLVGNSTSWGSKELTVKTGRAMLHNSENWLTSFDTDDPDDQLAFHADSVWYSTPESDGDGVPPCLREGRWASVRVGYTEVDAPDGHSWPVVAWVECL
jgi:hypothetical protein